MTIPSAAKADLRRIVRARRANFVAGLSAAAHHLVFRAPPSPLLERMAGRGMVALYLPVEDEAPVARMVPHLRAAGFDLCLPRVLGRSEGMDFRIWREEDPLEPGPLGTRHPPADAAIAQPDVILAPLLAFDRGMHRLGQGGGYYDRAFAAHPDALRVGVGWSVQETDPLPVDPWDMRLDAVVTECEFIEGEGR